MAREFISLSESDTRELRKSLGLPIFKTLRYMKKADAGWQEIAVMNYEIIDTYQPSETHSFVVTLVNGDKVRILQDYFIEMQKPSFVEDMNKQVDIVNIT